MSCIICDTQTDQHTCERCETVARDRLTDLPRWHAMAGQLIAPGSRGGDKIKTSERSLGVSVAALDVAAGWAWIETLHPWVRLVEEERDLSPSVKWRAGGAAATLQGHVSALLTHLAWMYARLEPVADFHEELRLMWLEGKRVCDTDPRATRYAATCPTDGCGARITLTGDDLAGDATCRRCGVTRPVVFLMRATDDAYVDAEALTHLYGVPGATLRRWAKQGTVRRRGTLLNVEDVQVALEAARDAV